MRMGISLLVVVGLAGLWAFPASGGPTDGWGQAWSPGGSYVGQCTASFDGVAAEFTQGNACTASGRLEPIPGTVQFHFVVQERDGSYCPQGMQGGTITVIDGPAVSAAGNASQFQFASATSDFCDGMYRYDDPGVHSQPHTTCTNSTSCSWDEFCYEGRCSGAIGRQWNLVFVSAQVGSRSPTGGAWDALGGAPDLQLCAYLPGTILPRCTEPVYDSFSASWGASLQITLNPGIRLILEDADAMLNEQVLTAIWDTADALINVARFYPEHLVYDSGGNTFTVRLIPDFSP